MELPAPPPEHPDAIYVWQVRCEHTNRDWSAWGEYGMALRASPEDAIAFAESLGRSNGQNVIVYRVRLHSPVIEPGMVPVWSQGVVVRGGLHDPERKTKWEHE